MKPKTKRPLAGPADYSARQPRIGPLIGLVLAIIAAFGLAGSLYREMAGQEAGEAPATIAQPPAESPEEVAAIEAPPGPAEAPESPPETPPPDPEPAPTIPPEPTDRPPSNQNSQPTGPPEPEPDPPATISPIEVELQPITDLEPPQQPVEPPDPEPDPEPSRDPDLAVRLNLSASAREKYWDHANPQIVSAATVRDACRQIEHIVHGCYIRSGRNEQIYIVYTTCPGLTESTAVHEMLHSVYSHLDSQERQRLRGWLLDFYNANPELVARLLAPYGPLSLDTQINELHSFVGQGVSQLPANLEAHYNQYFTDGRAAALAYHQQYYGLVESHQTKLDELNRQIRQQQAEIDSRQSEIRRQRAEIDDDLAWFEIQEAKFEEMRPRLSDPQVNEEYNRLIGEYNQRVGLYRQRVGNYNQLVGEHNRLVETARQLVGEHNRLVEQANRVNSGNCADPDDV